MEISVDRLYWPRTGREVMRTRFNHEFNAQIEPIEMTLLVQSISDLLFPLWTAPRNFSRKDLQL
jgi:hypothetical protein